MTGMVAGSDLLVRLEVLKPSTNEAGIVTGDKLSVGAARGNDVVVADPTVSRFHLEVEPEPEREGETSSRGVRVRDLNSTNGTRCEGAFLYDGVVPRGAILQLGESLLRVDLVQSTKPRLDVGSLNTPLLGQAPSMQKLLARMARVAQSDVTALIQGESGCGKELIARFIHDSSERASKPFVVVDCGTLSAHLIGSELFGHERGAFTGAHSAHAGAFERASGGTLFLDEIGELPLDLQPHLLGALDRKAARRVGGNNEIEFDVRVLCATNRDLRAGVNQGGFRLDLFYRLATVRLEAPPLRERAEDIPLLVEHFIQLAGHSLPHPLFPSERMRELCTMPWPGNVRELRNLVESTLVDEPAAFLSRDAKPTDAFDRWIGGVLNLPYRDARGRLIAQLERGYLKELLRRTDGNIHRSSRLARVDRSYLRLLLTRHGLRTKAGDKGSESEVSDLEADTPEQVQ